MKKKEGLKLSDIIILGVLCFFGYKFFTLNNIDNKNDIFNKDKEYNRTILIYMAPADLESDGGFASSNLAGIDPGKFDFEHNNLIVLAGGTNKWYNDFSKDTKAYRFTKDGFKEEYGFNIVNKNMGDANTLGDFLDYATDKYKADYNYLFFYGHGSGVSGIMYDEVYNDLLSLDEMINVLSFANIKKFEIIGLNSCMASNIELLMNMAIYTKYIIASEEIAWVTNKSFFSFLNDLDSKTGTIDFGKSFIDRYKISVDNIYADHQMGLIDTTNLQITLASLNTLFEKINIDRDYNNILTIRAKMHQFGMEEKSFDEVDLYDLMNNLMSYDKDTVNKFNKKYDDVMVYNYSNRDYMHGVSIYFPYLNNNQDYVPDLPIYLKYTKNGYYSFIRKFMEKQGIKYNY